MFFEPDTLLAGPRGRRLCFEVAMAAVERMIEADAREQWRASTVRHAARQADPDRPVARAYFGWGAREMPRPRRESSTGSPADALTGIPLARLGDADLLAALTMTVSRAAYWQPPDGEDMLAADPELRGPLLRAAGAIVASPAVAWWLDAFGDAGSGPPRQWAVDWEDEAHHGTGPVQRPVSGVLREWGEHVRACEERSRRERPLDPAANWSGEWWSVPPYDLATSTRELDGFGPVGLYLVEDDFGWDRAVARPVGIPPGLEIAVIRTADDWADLCREFPLAVTAEKRQDW